MNVQIELTADFEFHTGGDREVAVKLLDGLMLELVGLADTDCAVYDPAMSVDYSASRLTIELVAEAEGFDEAVALADSCVRSAAHAAGWNTPAWGLTKQSQSAELLDA